MDLVPGLEQVSVLVEGLELLVLESVAAGQGASLPGRLIAVNSFLTELCPEVSEVRMTAHTVLNALRHRLNQVLDQA